MTEENVQEPWVTIETLVNAKNGGDLQVFLETLTPADVARAISRLEEDAQAQLLTLLDPEDAAGLIEELPEAQAADLIEDLPAEQAATIVDEMDSDHRADVLAEMDQIDAEAILREMAPEEAEETRELLRHHPETAGGIMVKEFVVYTQDMKVGEVLDDLRTNAELYSDYGVQYAYVESDGGTLIGVLRLRDLVLSPNAKPISQVMIVNPVSVLDSAPLEELEQAFDRYMFSGLPVVSEDGKLVGVVQRADAEEAHSKASERTFMRFSGIIGGDELRSMPIAARSTQRLWWLGLNLVLSSLSAIIIIVFEGTVDKVLILAAIIPVLANVSGCSGNQAVAVTIREITLGILRPQDIWLVMKKELYVGLINGASLGVIAAVFIAFWRGDALLGGVVGTALAINVVLAVCVGGAIPLLLRRLGVDPAVAAAPMLTTLIDMCGFFLVLSLATAVLV